MQGDGLAGVQVYLPPNTRGVSYKEAWANAHKSFVAQHEDDPSYLLVYCDGSERYINGSRRAGYGSVGYCSRKVLFELKGPMEEGADVFEAETYSPGVAITRVFKGNDASQRPTRLFIFGDNTGALECLTLLRPRRGQNNSWEFRKYLAHVLLRDQPLETVISWCPAHSGIIGSNRADQLAKEGSLGL
jgi:ribonuclease HI